MPKGSKKNNKEKKTAKENFQTSNEKHARVFLQPDENKFVWAIRSDKIDWTDSTFGFHEEVLNNFTQTIKPKLDSYSSMTWNQVTTKDSCHSWDITDIGKELKGRILELHKDNPPESMYQISLTGKHRIWGYKDKSIFYLMFNDPGHEGYKVEKKHT